jgi:hypothetical protein
MPWNQPTTKVLWWVCLFIAPMVLLSIELFHPAGFTQDPGAYQYLSEAEPHTAQHKALDYFGPGWWVLLHMIQTPMVGLVAVGLWLLQLSLIRPMDSLGARIFAWLSGISTFVFVIYYTALDSIGGVGLGRSIEATERLAAEGRLTPEQVQGVALVLNTIWTDPIIGGVGSYISLTGSWAIFFATLFAAAALFLANRAPWPSLIILVAFGWELQLSHAMPHGPIAFGLLIISASEFGLQGAENNGFPWKACHGRQEPLFRQPDG